MSMARLHECTLSWTNAHLAEPNARLSATSGAVRCEDATPAEASTLQSNATTARTGGPRGSSNASRKADSACSGRREWRSVVSATDLSRGRPWESNRWGDAHSGCSRGLVTMQLWHGTLRMVPPAPRTSAVPFPFVPTHCITPPARPQEFLLSTLVQGGR